MNEARKRQWVVDFRDWFAEGQRLAAQEESDWPNSAPDADEYADYDDEAARLAVEAAFLLDAFALPVKERVS